MVYKYKNPVTIYKSSQVCEKKHPFIVAYGDIRASFKTKAQAERFKKNEMSKYYISSVNGRILKKS